jgi:uncharacterized membrane-anchored protein YitT (DUF2179 family)
MYLSAFTIGFSYFIGGLIPMVNVVSLFLWFVLEIPTANDS